MHGTRVAIFIGSVVTSSALVVLFIPQLLKLPEVFRAVPLAPVKNSLLVAPANEANETVDFIFVGDIMLDRHIRAMGRRYGEDHIFACVSEQLQAADYTVGNLEGPLTSASSLSEGSVVGSPQNFRFTFPVSAAATLKRHGFDALSLGNNHVKDFGSEGITETHRNLSDVNLAFFGGVAGDEPVHRTTIHGSPFSFVAYNQFGGSSASAVAARIAEEHAAGYTVIVFAHWGEEYVAHTASMREKAELFAQAGASLVVGAHPHVVQKSETILGVPVYYSLGNFIFDQYWDVSVSTGLMLKAAYQDGSWSFEEIPVVMHRDGRTCPRS